MRWEQRWRVLPPSLRPYPWDLVDWRDFPWPSNIDYVVKAQEDARTYVYGPQPPPEAAIARVVERLIMEGEEQRMGDSSRRSSSTFPNRSSETNSGRRAASELHFRRAGHTPSTSRSAVSSLSSAASLSQHPPPRAMALLNKYSHSLMLKFRSSWLQANAAFEEWIAVMDNWPEEEKAAELLEQLQPNNRELQRELVGELYDEAKTRLATRCEERMKTTFCRPGEAPQDQAQRRPSETSAGVSLPTEGNQEEPLQPRKFHPQPQEEQELRQKSDQRQERQQHRRAERQEERPPTQEQPQLTSHQELRQQVQEQLERHRERQRLFQGLPERVSADIHMRESLHIELRHALNRMEQYNRHAHRIETLIAELNQRPLQKPEEREEQEELQLELLLVYQRQKEQFIQVQRQLTGIEEYYSGLQRSRLQQPQIQQQQLPQLSPLLQPVRHTSGPATTRARPKQD